MWNPKHKKIALSKNYPIQDNPSSNIQFALPQTSIVKLEIFNAPV